MGLIANSLLLASGSTERALPSHPLGFCLRQPARFPTDGCGRVECRAAAASGLELRRRGRTGTALLHFACTVSPELVASLVASGWRMCGERAARPSRPGAPLPPAVLPVQVIRPGFPRKGAPRRERDVLRELAAAETAVRAGLAGAELAQRARAIAYAELDCLPVFQPMSDPFGKVLPVGDDESPPRSGRPGADSLATSQQEHTEVDEYIDSYTRAQALEDGFLVDVTEASRKEGILVPVALTAAVHEEYVVVPEGVVGQQSEARLRAILSAMRMQCPRVIAVTGEGRYSFMLHGRNDRQQGIPPLVELTVVLAGGDAGEPVLTIMLPNED